MAFADAFVKVQIEQSPDAVTVVSDAGSTKGLLSLTESVADFGGLTPAFAQLSTEALGVGERRTSVFVWTGRLAAGQALAGLAEDDTLTVDGTAYRVRSFGPIDDGLVTRIRLAAA